MGEGVRAQVLRRSFCTFVAEDSEIAPAEAAALTGHDELTWWRNYVQPRCDAESRRSIVDRLAERGIGVRPG